MAAPYNTDPAVIQAINDLQTAVKNLASIKQLNQLNNQNQIRLANLEATVASLQTQITQLQTSPR